MSTSKVGVTLLHAHGRFRASHVVEAGGRTLESPWIFINVGARPRIPDFPFGSAVTVVEQALHLAPKEDDDVSEEIRAILEGEGISLDPIVAESTDELEYLEESARLARQRLRPGEEHAQSKGVKLRSLNIYEEHVWKAIIDEARANVCDLIFMAARGTKSRLSLLIGSETAKVLTHAMIPVMACR